jgi:hypothetical protein
VSIIPKSIDVQKLCKSYKLKIVWRTCTSVKCRVEDSDLCDADLDICVLDLDICVADPYIVYVYQLQVSVFWIWIYVIRHLNICVLDLDILYVLEIWIYPSLICVARLAPPLFPSLKGHGNEADFLGFLHKSVRHRSLTLHFEPFQFLL